MLWREVSASRAGSRRHTPGWCGRVRLPPSPEGLDDGHAPAAAGTGREPIERFRHFDRLRRRCHGQQFAGTRDVGLACGTGEQAVMADAVEAPRQALLGWVVDTNVLSNRGDVEANPNPVERLRRNDRLVRI